MSQPSSTGLTRGHVVAGAVMVALGGAGLSRFWDAAGLVSRGLVPFGLLGSGLVMVGAGIRFLRESNGRGPRLAGTFPFWVLMSGVALVLVAAGGPGLATVAQSWTAGQVVGYMSLGLVSGIVGGMLGLGGGLVHLSGLTLLFGMPFGFARGATLINNVFINAAAAWRYGRRGFVVLQAVALLLPAALVGVTLGSLVQARLDEVVLRRVLAVFVTLLIGAILFDTFKAPALQENRPYDHAPVPLLLSGGLSGLLCGILGISGGVVAVPGQTLLSGIGLKNAIANATVVTAVSSALGALLIFVGGTGPALDGHEMTTIALLFIPGNLVGGHLGANWLERLPVRAVRAFFVLLLMLIAVRSWTFAQG